MAHNSSDSSDGTTAPRYGYGSSADDEVARSLDSTPSRDSYVRSVRALRSVKLEAFAPCILGAQCEHDRECSECKCVGCDDCLRSCYNGDADQCLVKLCEPCNWQHQRTHHIPPVAVPASKSHHTPPRTAKAPPPSGPPLGSAAPAASPGLDAPQGSLMTMHGRKHAHPIGQRTPRCGGIEC